MKSLAKTLLLDFHLKAADLAAVWHFAKKKPGSEMQYISFKKEVEQQTQVAEQQSYPLL